MTVRGVRGATVAAGNKADEILSATRELLDAVLQANPELNTADIASVLFTATQDLTAAYPATAARLAGWVDVPLIDALEISVPGGLARCIRVLILWNTEKPQLEIRHVYLREAARLRPDLADGSENRP